MNVSPLRKVGARLVLRLQPSIPQSIMRGMDHAPLRPAWLAALLLPLLAWPAAAGSTATRLNYAAYIGGLNAFDLTATVAMSPQSYRMEVVFRLTGTIGALIHAESTSTVDGRFDGTTPEPRMLFSAGHFRGRPHVMQMEWPEGKPLIRQMSPPDEDQRDPVPPEQQAHTMDSLSAIVALLQRVATTGRCDGVVRTFDGRRLSELAAHTVGEETLPETDRSPFKGPALRCDVEGRQLAGFPVDGDQAELRRPHHGSAWFASLAPGEPLVPVRITFGERSFGQATLYLTGRS